MFRFRNVVVLVARQNGKSMLGQVLSLYALYVLGVRLVLGTAQDLDTAEEVWEGALELIEETPALAARALKPVKVNGKKAIRLKTGERYKVKAANRRAGRGLSGDLILLDELREHQTWDAWSAISKTTNARPNALIWCMSNAGDVTSVVLRHLRKIAHRALGDPDGIVAAEDPSRLLPSADELDGMDAVELNEDDEFDPDELNLDDDFDTDDLEVEEDTLFLAEWSMPLEAFKTAGEWPPKPTMGDLQALAQANPSLGYGLVTMRALLSSLSTDPEWEFRTEVGCQWSEGTLEGIFPPGTWEAGIDEASTVAEGVPLGLCLDTSADRSMTYATVAGRRDDGAVHVEVVKRGAGQDWVEEWLNTPAGPDRPPRREEFTAGITGQKNGATVSPLLQRLRVAGFEVVDWSGGDLAGAHGEFHDAVRDGRVKHRPQPALDLAAATASTRNLGGDGWVIDRSRSPVDPATLVGAIGAHWLITRPTQAPAVSEYETGRLEVV